MIRFQRIHTATSGLFGLVVLLLAHPATLQGSPIQSEDPATRVDELMAAYTGGPGGVVAVVEDGGVVFAKAYGLANLEHDVPMTRETVLDVGSVAKQFTAFAIVLLAERGELSLDDDIRKHLDGIPDFGHIITVRQLVHHMSGLREIYTSHALAGYQSGDGISQEDALWLTSRMRELNFEPGTQYLYSNTGYMLLADIVATTSGMSFPEFMAENVFGPLDMTHTTIMAKRGQVIPGAAESYDQEGEDGFRRVFDNSGVQGAGGIYTTADDLALWMSNYGTRALGGERAGEQRLQRGILADGDTLPYAFGINIGERRGLDVLAHGGSSAGYRASFTYFPGLDGGVITMSNFGGFDGTIAGEVAAAFFGDHMDPLPAPSATAGRPEVQVEEAILEDYVGAYQLYPTFALHVTHDGSTLLVGGEGPARNPATASSDSTFYLANLDAVLTFHRGDDGAISGLTVYQHETDFPAPRVKVWTPSNQDLGALAGRYYSPELETVYTLVMEGGKLIAKHRRHPDFELEPAEEDTFAGASFFGTARFERNADGEPTGMRVSNGRVLNLLFERLDG